MNRNFSNLSRTSLGSLGNIDRNQLGNNLSNSLNRSNFSNSFANRNGLGNLSWNHSNHGNWNNWKGSRGWNNSHHFNRNYWNGNWSNYRRNSYWFGFGSPFGNSWNRWGHGYRRPWYGYSYSPWFGYGLGYGLWGFGYGGYGGYGYGYPYYSYSPVYSYSTTYYPAYATDTTAPAYVTDPTAVAAADDDAALAAAQQDPNAAANSDGTDYASMGEIDFKGGRYQEAVRDWRHALVEDPGNPGLVLMMAQALFQTGQWEEAAGAVQYALRALPQDKWGAVVSNYSQLYGNVSDYTTQMRALEKARNEKQDNPAIRFLLGYHYAFLGYPKEAVRELDAGMAAAPKDEVALKLRDMMAVKAGLPTIGPAAGSTTPAVPGAGVLAPPTPGEATPAGGNVAPPVGGAQPQVLPGDKPETES